MGHDVGALPLPEQQLTLVRSCEPGDSGPTRNAVGRLTCGLPLRREHSLRALSAVLAAHPVLRSSFELPAEPAPEQVFHREVVCSPASSTFA